MGSTWRCVFGDKLSTSEGILREIVSVSSSLGVGVGVCVCVDL